MATLQFFEKPGCINNGKQKAILREAGHTLEVVDILHHAWDTKTLLPFVEGKQPTQMMNHTAPAIKNGDIDPDSLSFDQALAMMIKEPLLIKRPLIRVADLYLQGFDHDDLRPYLGNWDGKEDVTTCPQLQTLSCDEQQGNEQQ